MAITQTLTLWFLDTVALIKGNSVSRVMIWLQLSIALMTKRIRKVFWRVCGLRNRDQLVFTQTMHFCTRLLVGLSFGPSIPCCLRVTYSSRFLMLVYQSLQQQRWQLYKFNWRESGRVWCNPAILVILFLKMENQENSLVADYEDYQVMSLARLSLLIHITNLQ